MCSYDQYCITGSMVVSSAVPMFHVMSWGVPFITLTLGARTILTGRYTQAEHLLDTMQAWDVEWIAGVPAVWQRMREVIQQRGVEEVRSALKIRRILAGGSAPAPECMEWYAKNLGLEFMQGWGMTETNPLGTNARYINTHRDRSKTQLEQYQNLSRAGLPIPGIEMRIVNPNDLDQEVAHGSQGELLVRGPLVITKYYGNEAPEMFHDGWLLTGDVAKLDANNEIVICDRTKDFIKSGGEWISSVALETCISKLEGISMVAVVGVPHPKWDERPIAIVTIMPGATPPSKDLTQLVREHCSHSFAKFQLPDDVLVWESMPLNSTGKMDKKMVRKMLAEDGYTLPRPTSSMLSPMPPPIAMAVASAKL